MDVTARAKRFPLVTGRFPPECAPVFSWNTCRCYYQLSKFLTHVLEHELITRKICFVRIHYIVRLGRTTVFSFRCNLLKNNYPLCTKIIRIHFEIGLRQERETVNFVSLLESRQYWIMSPDAVQSQEFNLDFDTSATVYLTSCIVFQ